MKMRLFSWILVGLLVANAAHALTITHDPVPFAVRGQPLTLRAKVEGASAPQSVTLYYQLFKDAAPFRVAMKSSGLGYYVGAIEANLLSGVESVSYYIEAQEAEGLLAETEWYVVKFREPRPSERAAPAVAPPPAPAPAGPAPAMPVSDSGSSWRTPALIAGGAAVVLGGAYLISENSSSGGGGGGGGDASTNAPGTYVGTVVFCTTPPGEATSCETDPFSLLIDSRNVVFSESIRPGQQLTSPLVNNRFTFTAAADGGSIVYNGAWAEGTVVGQITGSSTSAAGPIVYSGTFSANKQ